MISVIVPAYNEGTNIENCLHSLLSQKFPRNEFEIIVSDSSSTDNTAAVAKKLADKVVVCKKVSAGFGRNAGAKKAKGSIIAFIDADSIAGKSWLSGIKQGLGEESCVALTGPFESLEKDSLLVTLFYFGWSLENRLAAAAGFPLFPGFNIAVKKKAFNAVGGFREDNMVCEDFDLSLKLRKLGKVKFNKKMFAGTSSRRMKEMGIARYALHGLMYLLFKKKYTWADHRPDW